MTSSPTADAAPRLAICGIHIESSTFTPHISGLEAFDVRRGPDLVERYPFLTAGAELRDAAQWIGILHARALPGGPVPAEVFDDLASEICEGLAAAQAEAPLDGILFDIHGAMSVVGRDDAEGALIGAIREVVGPDVLVAAPMDLHGNVSHALFEGVDALTCYRTAPHVDTWETRERAARALVTGLGRGERPHAAMVHVPILLPGEMTSTRIEPARSLYARIPELTERPGVDDVALWIGFAWADEPRNQAAVVATGTDGAAVRAAASELADALWKVRHEFAFVAPVDSIEACVDAAIASTARPFLISDSGDNPGAGGADDVTICLAELLGRPEIRGGGTTALLASIVDPDAVRTAIELGVGGSGGFVVGGRIDTRAPGPVALDAEVLALADSAGTGTAAALRVVTDDGPTGLVVVVTSRRAQYGRLGMFAELGLNPREVDIVVVKMGYLEPDLHEIRGDWMMALTPGGVDQDLVRLGHSRIRRPMLPFDAEIPRPSAEDVMTGGGGAL